ncbi:Crp/Fnr family transcriptional regulator [Lunatimonas salinarum]|uniref:Crp/Fnr family transcriptional regulator n=1 Tax=Lunatimonas salinarum TaxID=1774590 RepID=UPI001ADF99F6|nr:Crp/Fnr family transcriptional regulator [Lunatimonas salinarum]
MGSIPDREFDRFMGLGEVAFRPKGSRLLVPGARCDWLFFFDSGMARSFYLREGKDVTVSFTRPGEFVTSMASFITGKPSYEGLEVITDAHVWMIKRESLMELVRKELFWAEVYRKSLEEYYVRIEEAAIFSKFKPARERYEELLRESPEIVQSASIGHIASYLGISIETLSRIRGSR